MVYNKRLDNLQILNELDVNGVTHFFSDVEINGDLVVNGSTSSLETNNLEEIENLKQRLEKLEQQNKEAF